MITLTQGGDEVKVVLFGLWVEVDDISIFIILAASRWKGMFPLKDFARCPYFVYLFDVHQPFLYCKQIIYDSSLYKKGPRLTLTFFVLLQCYIIDNENNTLSALYTSVPVNCIDEQLNLAVQSVQNTNNMQGID